MNFYCRYCLLAVILGCLPAISPAEEGAGWFDNYIPPEKWKESAVTVPPWPEQDDLLEIPMDRTDYPFRGYVDSKSLSIGADGVVRYALVIVSSSGTWNASYEGMRCGKEEYRRYAYGTGRQWQQVVGSAWQRILDGGTGRYRKTLYQDYLCNVAGANPDVREIVDRIRYQRGSFQDD